MGRSEIRRGRGASALVLGLTCLATACGGGGGSSPTPGPAPANRAPAFSSATTAAVIENTAAAFYTPAASDPDGDSLTITIAGGADASAFALTGGALAFAGPRNFDLPTDADRDNVYKVTLSVSDGKGGAATLDLSVTITNSKEGISVRRIATGFTNPAALASDQNGAAIIVGEGDGTLYRVDGTTGTRTSLTPLLQDRLPAGARLLGMTKGYAADGAPYAGLFRLVRAANNAIYVTAIPNGGEYYLGSFGTLVADGAIATDRFGVVYAAVGDPVGTAAQTDGSGFGKLWRLDKIPDPYAGASFRGFFTTTQVARGIRDPGGMALVGGLLTFADRGGSRADELSEYVGAPGANFGWPFIEGEDMVSSGAPAGLARAIFTMPLGTGARQSSGLIGPVHSGAGIDSLMNHIVIADRDGTIWSYSRTAYQSVTQVGPDRLELRTEDFRPDVGTISAPVAIAQDAQGTIYILDGDGELFRVEAG